MCSSIALHISADFAVQVFAPSITGRFPFSNQRSRAKEGFIVDSIQQRKCLPTHFNALVKFYNMKLKNVGSFPRLHAVGSFAHWFLADY
jgi:hypothetical protein